MQLCFIKGKFVLSGPFQKSTWSWENNIHWRIRRSIKECLAFFLANEKVFSWTWSGCTLASYCILVVITYHTASSAKRCYDVFHFFFSGIGVIPIRNNPIWVVPCPLKKVVKEIIHIIFGHGVLQHVHFGGLINSFSKT